MKKTYTLRVPVEIFDDSHIRTLIQFEDKRITHISFIDYDTFWAYRDLLSQEESLLVEEIFRESKDVFLELKVTEDTNTNKIAIAKRMKLTNINPKYKDKCMDYKFTCQEDAILLKNAIKNNLTFLRNK